MVAQPYKIVFSKQAAKDLQRLRMVLLDKKVKKLVEILKQDPFMKYPPYEKLVGNLQGFYSRRINVKHRLVYEVDEKRRVVKILRMWTHYE